MNDLLAKVAEVEKGEPEQRQGRLDGVYSLWAGRVEAHMDQMWSVERVETSSRRHPMETVCKGAAPQGAMHQTGDPLGFVIRRLIGLLDLFVAHRGRAPQQARAARVGALKLVPPVGARPAWITVRQAIREWPG